MESNEDLLYKYRTYNDRDAFEKLCEKNSNLIRYVMSNFIDGYYLKYEEDELFSVGYVGLIKAIRNYDLNKIGEIKFSTYAANCIRNCYFAESRKQSRFYGNIDLYEGFVSKNEYSDEMYEYDFVVKDEDNGILNYEEKDYKEYKRKKIDKALSKLTERQRKIIELRYGFGKNEPMTQAQVAKIVNVSSKYVSYVLKRVKQILIDELKEFKKEYVEVDDNLKKKIKVEPYTKENLIDMYGIEKVENVMKFMSPSCKQIVELYYGFNGNVPHKQNQIAKQLNVSQSLVSIKLTIFNKALTKSDEDLFINSSVVQLKKK